MNDPGLDGPIAKAQDDLQSNGDTWAQEEEDERMLLQPTRYWFASTAFPLLAGTFGPVASGFNIAALAQEWREYIPQKPGFIEDNGYRISDPDWLLIVNGVSLAIALVANFALLFNMTGRVSFIVAQPIIIVGFYLASFLLIALAVVANTDVFQIRPAIDHALTQAYYYACFAAGIYSLLASLMLVTVWGALVGKYDRKYQITDSQRTLMLQTISFMGYLLVGAAIYSHIEGWTYNDALYFADFTLLTIGIGDNFTPLTHSGRALVIPYTFGGLLAVGLIVGSIRSMLLESGSQKMHARATENKRENVHTLDNARSSTILGRLVGRRGRQEHEFESVPEKERRRVEFHRMRKIKSRAERKYRYTSLLISVFDASLLWFIGALVFWYTEYKQDWSYFVSLYFSWTSLTTVGYGDFQPLSNSGKSFFVLWSLLAIPTLTVLISDMGDTIVKGMSDLTNWVGALTIAPREKDFYDRLKTQVNIYSRQKLFKNAKPSSTGGNNDLISIRTGDSKDREGSVNKILTSRLTTEERKMASAYANDTRSGSALEQDRAFYLFILRKEVKALVADSESTPPKLYTYDEWSYFLRLIGHDESDVNRHTRRYNGPKRDNEPAPQVGRIVAHDGTPKKWSWLGLRSPLLSSKSEASWILSALIAVLGKELSLDFKQRSDRSEVPISLMDLQALDAMDDNTESTCVDAETRLVGPNKNPC